MKQVKVSDLIPYINNAKKHPESQVTKIAASIKEFGFTNPILTDGKNGVIAGHGRLLAAQKLGIDTVPVIELSHLSEAQRKAYIIADNKLAESEWDTDILKIELEGLKDLEFDIDLTGFQFDGFEAEEVEMPELKSGDREPFQQMTFTLHDDQVEQIKAACDIAKKMGEFDSLNENSNGNALARVCETFLTHYGNS